MRMGVQPSKSFISNPPFKPGAAAFLDCRPYFFGSQLTAPFPAQSDRERDKAFQISRRAKLLVKLPVRQHHLAETFQAFAKLFRRPIHR